MLAVVTYPYTDRETGAVRCAGERLDLSDERFAELFKAGHVKHAPALDEVPETDTPEQEEPAEEAAEKPRSPEMTIAQLRAAIEAKGGFAPKKANKAQLAAILGTL